MKTGVDTVLGEIRAGRARLVLVASDASERTKKQLRDKCTYYNVRHVAVQMTADALASLIGKRSLCAAIALTPRGPWKAATQALLSAEQDVPLTTEDRKDDN